VAKERDSRQVIAPKKCSAKSSRTGEPCKKYAIVGGSVCDTHGGRAPQVREAARRRIEAMVPDALDGIELLAGITGPGSQKDEVRLRALQDILDRAGLKGADKLEVSEQQLSNEQLDDLIAGSHGSPVR
jgi:hypothetical protein